MIANLPNELLFMILDHLDYQDIVCFHTSICQQCPSLASSVSVFIQQHYNFHYRISTLLQLFEAIISPSERQSKETKQSLANRVLQTICQRVEKLPKYEHRNEFTKLLDIVQQLVIRRILDSRLKAGLEHDYANLCLEIRTVYLHTPSIRVLHDPKYRRRSTKHPLAPFLPRDYTSIWREHCAQYNNRCQADLSILQQQRKIHARFASFFGSLFDATSLYLESNLDGTFEECAREALVTGNVEDLLILCVAADKPVDVEGMCMMVHHAGEQLRHYLETMETYITTDPSPEQELRLRQQREQEFRGTDNDSVYESPPDWLIPDRYKVESDTVLRLKLMNNLYKKGWHWFQ